MSILFFLYRVIPYSVHEIIFPIYSKCRFASEYKEILHILSERKSSDEEAAELADLMLATGYVSFFYGEWIKEQQNRKVVIERCKESKEHYVVHQLEYGSKQRCIYFPEWMNKSFCESHYRLLLREQDYRSPHFYFSERVRERLSPGNSTVLDIGSSEGIFTMEALGETNRCICFEPDSRWNKPFIHTFSEEYGKRVKLVNSFVSDHSADNTVSIDEYFDKSIPDDISVVKLDIEGGEQKALLGMRRTLEANPSAIVLVCAYHTQGAEKEIREILEPMGYKVRARRGYVLTYAMPGFEKPYIRHCVLEAVKD